MGISASDDHPASAQRATLSIFISLQESECINHGGLCLPGSGFKLLTTDETTIGVELASPGSNAPRSARTVSILATSDFPISLSTLHEEVEELV